MTPEEHNNTCSDKSCTTGGCGNSKGVCPGIALMIGLISSSLISSLSGFPKIQLPLMILISTLLILGIYPTGGRWFSKKPAQKEL